jgi:hypothetical protein
VISNISDHAHKSGMLLEIDRRDFIFYDLGYPLLRTIACVGGTAMKDQLETIKK